MTMTIIRPDSKLLAPLEDVTYREQRPLDEREERDPPLFFTNLKCKFRAPLNHTAKFNRAKKGGHVYAL